MTSNCRPDSETCTTIPVPPITGKIPTYDGGSQKFYKVCTEKHAIVPVPVIEIKKIERCDFKKHTYMVDCCEVTVCIPCQSCITESKHCTVKNLLEKISICERYDGTFDVYVLDAPGMPQRWVLLMAATKQEVDDLKAQ